MPSINLDQTPTKDKIEALRNELVNTSPTAPITMKREKEKRELLNSFLINVALLMRSESIRTHTIIKMLCDNYTTINDSSFEAGVLEVNESLLCIEEMIADIRKKFLSGFPN